MTSIEEIAASDVNEMAKPFGLQATSRLGQFERIVVPVSSHPARCAKAVARSSPATAP